MSLSISFDGLSRIVHQDLARATMAQAREGTRLVSGNALTRAGDDAAGASRITRLDARLAGLGRAAGNLNDGISLIATTQGALDDIDTALQAIRTVTVRAASGTFSVAERDDFQAEIERRLSDIDRIAGQTVFNGIHTLDGSRSSIALQIGADLGQTQDIALSGMTSDDLGLAGLNVIGYVGHPDIVTQDPQGRAYAYTVFAPDGEDISGFGYRLYRDEASRLFASNNNGTSFVQASHIVTDEAMPRLSIVVHRDLPVGARSADPLARVDQAIAGLDALRGRLGALHGRLEDTGQQLASTRVALAGARSNIADADTAREATSWVRARLQIDTGSAVLALADASRRQVLRLIDTGRAGGSGS